MVPLLLVLANVGLGHDKWELDPNEIRFMRELGSGNFGVVKEGLYKASAPRDRRKPVPAGRSQPGYGNRATFGWR